MNWVELLAQLINVESGMLADGLWILMHLRIWAGEDWDQMVLRQTDKETIVVRENICNLINIERQLGGAAGGWQQ